MPLSLHSEWLRTAAMGKPVGVDKEKGIIYGYVVAEKGPFKSQGRGEFDDEGLSMIASQMNAKPNGVKSRFAHPSLSGDGLGKFLGRGKSARVDGPRVRADLHIDPTSHKTPSGDIGGYVMDLAASDPEAFGSSLVLKPKEVYRMDEKNRPLRGPDGEALPPLWYPEKIHASDVVDDGDAVHGGFLSANLSGLPDAIVRQAAAALDTAFAGQPREVVAARAQDFLSAYLDNRYGEQAGKHLDTLRRRLQQNILQTKFDTLIRN